jgi:hypothetical protein
MPAQALILLVPTLPKRKSAALDRLRERLNDDDEIAQREATSGGLHSVALQAHRERRAAVAVAPRMRLPAARKRRSGMFKSYTTTLPDAPPRGGALRAT